MCVVIDRVRRVEHAPGFPPRTVSPTGPGYMCSQSVSGSRIRVDSAARPLGSLSISPPFFAGLSGPALVKENTKRRCRDWYVRNHERAPAQALVEKVL